MSEIQNNPPALNTEFMQVVHHRIENPSIEQNEDVINHFRDQMFGLDKSVTGMTGVVAIQRGDMHSAVFMSYRDDVLEVRSVTDVALQHFTSIMDELYQETLKDLSGTIASMSEG